ncbi:MAG TPA: mannanase, partial [Bacteroidota bacterium]
MKTRIAILILFLFLGAMQTFFSSCSILSVFERSDDFVRVQGTQLFHNGSPYYFAGTNMWYGCYLGSPGSTGDRPRLLRELDSLKSYGFTNVRALAASEQSALRRSVKPAIQTAPGVVDDSLLQGLDFFLAQMSRRGMHAVLYLGNYWEWSGGMSQYNVWSGAHAVDPEDTTQGWGAFMDFSATFYANPKSQKLYRNYLRMIIERKNTVNGRRYACDPTIMAWQLANEPRPGREHGSGEKNLSAFCKWIDETAMYIHSLDTNHIVSSGSEGTIGTLRSEDLFVQAFQTPHIDYLTFHLWPRNWGWFNPERWEETLPASEANAKSYIEQHLALARKIGKPIVMEEFGLDRDNGSIFPGTPVR